MGARVEKQASTPMFDKAEMQDPLFRQSGLMAKLRKQLGHAKAHSSHWQTALSDIDPESIQSRDDLAQLPICAKAIWLRSRPKAICLVASPLTMIASNVFSFRQVRLLSRKPTLKTLGAWHRHFTQRACARAT